MRRCRLIESLQLKENIKEGKTLKISLNNQPSLPTMA
ncbi:hypothetical protein AREALGSMS7_01619 [Arenibacter algicola]|uniref:Uncharacterized protein n=1 Tax=Arenibacter algicola TaxID=616991 RepID=A0A221UUS8_9FLAO|nr:hypothetical protein AREALGSMS7_01619 [Arenibacter algicola]